MQQTIERCIERLAHMTARKPMYVYPLTVDTMKNFLNGFVCAYSACDNLQWPRDIRRRVEERRGWRKTPTGPIQQMQANGMTDEQIMDEMIAIEVDVLREGQQARAAQPAV